MSMNYLFGIPISVYPHELLREAVINGKFDRAYKFYRRVVEQREMG